LQALGLLVPVSLKGYPSYTPGLSTWSSPRGLTPTLSFTDQVRSRMMSVPSAVASFTSLLLLRLPPLSHSLIG